MRKRFFASILLLVTILFIGKDNCGIKLPVLVKPVSAQTSPAKTQIIVVYKTKPSSTSLLDVANKVSNVSPKYGLTSSNAMVYSLESGNLQDTINTLRSNPNVQYAYPSYRVGMLSVPNDTYIQATPAPNKPRVQWNMFNLKLADTASSAWDLTTGADSATVAIIDSGIDSTHPELSGKIVTSVNCALAGPCAVQGGMTDEIGHGTHVSGLIAAATNNSSGIAGAGYNTKLMMIKVVDAYGAIESAYLLNAIRYAADNGAKIVNISLGSLEDNMDEQAKQDLCDGNGTTSGAIKYAWDKGTLVVAAAGNCGAADNSGIAACGIYDAAGQNIIDYARNSKMYPAACNNVLSVGATTVDNTLASYSEHNDTTHGNWVSVGAPGGFSTSNCNTGTDEYNCILSTVPNGYAYLAGTSMASPQVAGIAALLLAKNSTLTNSAIKQAIENSANGSIAVGSTNHGLVDSYAALNSLSSLTGTPAPTVTTGPTNTPAPTTTPTAIPTPTITAYPTTHAARLPKTLPDPYPPAPYCPNPANCTRKTDGDTNCDGVVNFDDFWTEDGVTNDWRYEFDTMPPFEPVNMNANFSCIEGNSTTYFVDLVDYEIWRRHTINGLITPGAATATPPNPTATGVQPTITGQPTATRTPTPTSGLCLNKYACPGPDCDKCKIQSNSCVRCVGGDGDWCPNHPLSPDCKDATRGCQGTSPLCGDLN